MENNSYASNAYLETKIKSAAPIDLVITLYEGGIKFLNIAKESFNARDKVQMVDNILRAQDVIRELRDSLDMEVKDIANNLYSLYRYMDNQLMQANRDKDIKHVDLVITMMTELKDTWLQVKENFKLQNNIQHRSTITGFQA